MLIMMICTYKSLSGCLCQSPSPIHEFLLNFLNEMKTTRHQINIPPRYLFFPQTIFIISNLSAKIQLRAIVNNGSWCPFFLSKKTRLDINTIGKELLMPNSQTQWNNQLKSPVDVRLAVNNNGIRFGVSVISAMTHFQDYVWPPFMIIMHTSSTQVLTKRLHIKNMVNEKTIMQYSKF